MAPELRKRKGAINSEKVTVPSKKGIAKKSAVTTKRKAIIDESPQPVKKQKPTSRSAKFEKASTSTKSDEPEKEFTSRSVKPSKVPTPKKVAQPAKEATRQNTKGSKSESEKEVEKSEINEEAPTSDGMLLLADELDSGGEEAVDAASAFKPGQDVGKIPKVSKKDRKAAPQSEVPESERGVIYIGRIPHGFYEHEMRKYFSQFGPVTRLRLSRNKKTGASRHFAFVEFEEESTAEIVAKSMNNYLLFGHLLKVKMVPKSQIHPELFKGANKRFKKIPWSKVDGRKLAQPRTVSAWEAKVESERTKREERAAKLKDLMDYEYAPPALEAIPAPLPAKEAEAAVGQLEA